MPRRWYSSLAAALLVFGIVGAACGNDGDSAAERGSGQPTVAPAGGGVSSSSVAADTFLTFEGQRYRLVDLEQANLVDDSDFEQIGAASDADIDQADLTVYSRTGDDVAIYTYASEQPEPGEVAAVEGEDATTPALWYRWAPEP